MGHTDRLGRKHLALDTRDMSPLDNYQTHTMELWEMAQVEKLFSQFRNQNVEFLQGPCPIYNCHGLTFASRRSTVDEETPAFERILKEDGYEPVPPGGNARVGDIVVYCNERLEFFHSGIVVSIIKAEGGLKDMPRVWSKWGKGHEALHPLHSCPYPQDAVRYYRLKKWQNTTLVQK